MMISTMTLGTVADSPYVNTAEITTDTGDDEDSTPGDGDATPQDHANIGSDGYAQTQGLSSGDATTGPKATPSNPIRTIRVTLSCMMVL